jgi:hypothetical protein
MKTKMPVVMNHWRKPELIATVHLPNPSWCGLDEMSLCYERVRDIHTAAEEAICEKWGYGDIKQKMLLVSQVSSCNTQY